MSAGPMAERVYETLRRRILDGGFRPGERLDPALLAATLASSVTPVRDALNVLVGEGLVDTRTGGGFHLRSLDAVGLAELYDWAADVGDIMLAHIARQQRIVPLLPAGPEIASLFDAIAAGTRSAEHAAVVRQLNASLALPRLVEREVLAESQAQRDELLVLAAAGDIASLRPSLRRYHRRRGRVAAAIVRAVLRRQGPEPE